MSAISFLGSGASISTPMGGTMVFVTPQTGASNAKGAWIDAIAAASNTIQTAWIALQAHGTATNDYLLDVGIGSAGSEVVVVANIPLSVNSTAAFSQCNLLLPLSIPPGVRIAIRGQNSSGSTSTCRVGFQAFAVLPGGERGLGATETSGAVTATSLGTSVDPGGTANTKGSWQVLNTATSFPYRWGCLIVNHTNVLAITTARWAIDVGVGGAGSEVVVLGDVMMAGSSTNDATAGPGISFPCLIPAGSRLSVRAAHTVNTATERLLEAVFIGVG